MSIVNPRFYEWGGGGGFKVYLSTLLPTQVESFGISGKEAVALVQERVENFLLGLLHAVDVEYRD